MSELSSEVCFDLKSFIFSNIDSWRKDAKEYDGMDLTIACSDDGSTWSFQTGDNSYTGGAYGLPHWSVCTLLDDSDPLRIYEDVIDQLSNLIADI